MKKIFFVITVFAFLFIFNKPVHAQFAMDFEEFMGMMSETMTEAQLDELSYQLPWNIKVMAYGYGDFSGDGKEDIILSIFEKDETPKKSVDVYFFRNKDNKTYKLVEKKNFKWVELTIEVAFLVADGECKVTSRDNNNWYFTHYKIKGSKLLQTEKESFPIEFEKAGE